MSLRLTLLFPIFAIAASIMAWQQPQWLNSFGSWIIPILMFIMFAMGLTISSADVKRVTQHKTAIAIGVITQYTVMPLTAFVIAKAAGLSNELLIGMVLVGSASGGTASNVICYLARADLALSVSMTLVSTMLAIIALPALSWLYLGQVVPVPVGSMFLSVLKIVLLPLITGFTINHFASAKVKLIQPLLPAITTAAIVLVIAIIVSLNQPKLALISAPILLAVVTHNLIGLSAGYGLAKLLKQDERVSRTIAIEVGMQNSGLAVALAVKYFSPITALPGAIFSIWHNVSGSLLAGYWGKQNNHK